MATLSVEEVALERAPWQSLQPLLDNCYPRPPRDVFHRVVAGSHQRQRLWVASNGDSLLGVVMLCPHSKGGHLDNLAVLPRARGQGIGQKLVHALLQEVSHQGAAMVSLSTRIPRFFLPFGFQPCGQLTDGSTAMLMLLPAPAVSELLEP
jgi:ribosomal protein S18 acetylase RimI-like enzyme